MAISNNLNSTLSLNTAGGTNSPNPTTEYDSTTAVGTYSAGPITMNITSTPVAMPLSSTPATAVYVLDIQHIGASTDPVIIVDMQNTAAASSKISLSPGGKMTFYNVILPITGTGATNWTTWQLSTASGTAQCAISFVYT